MRSRKPDVNDLLDDLLSDPQVQKQWELDPSGVAREYELTETQLQSLIDGDVDSLISEGLAERHVQQMRVSW
jgi:hypothetical protein